MFTGLVQETGKVRSVRRSGGALKLAVECSPAFAASVATGDSVAVNGCCLTATAVEDSLLRFDAVEETASRTTLPSLAPGSPVNLEPALRADSRLGGHIVQGHVDCTGRVVSIQRRGTERRITVELPPEAAAECVEKGGIAVDGVSLTIASLDGRRVSVAVIPHTWENTTLRFLRPGDSVNIETDVIGKYVLSAVRAILGKDGRSGLDADFLRRHGFA